MFIKNSYFSRKNFQKQLKLTQNSEEISLCDFDTGLFLTCNQIFKMCEEIQDTGGNYLIIQDAGNYLFIKDANYLTIQNAGNYLINK